MAGGRGHNRRVRRGYGPLLPSQACDDRAWRSLPRLEDGFVVTVSALPTSHLGCPRTPFGLPFGATERTGRQARKAAGGLDVRIGGGPSTIRQFLAADLIDYLHVVVVPFVLERGERLWDGLEGLEHRFDVESAPSGVTHLTLTRREMADH